MINYFEVGQKVYDIRKGQGVVICVDLTPKVLSYAVTVDFANNIRAYYTPDGRYSNFDLCPCLFQNMPIIVENIPLLN